MKEKYISHRDIQQKLLSFLPPKDNISEYCAAQRQLLYCLSKCFYYMPGREIEISEGEAHRHYKEMINEILGNKNSVL